MPPASTFNCGLIPTDAFAMIIGAMKCGTSSLFKHLSLHPAICPALVKEPEFFSHHQRHGHPVGRYPDLWDFDPKVHQWALEASAGYAKFPSETDVPERIHAAGLSPRFFYLVRDPFERIESHFNFMQRLPDWRLSIDDTYLVAVSNYRLQIERYRRWFSRESICILDFAELRDDPERCIKRALAHLALPRLPENACFLRENQTTPLSAAQLTANRLGLRPLLDRLPAHTRRRLKPIVHRLTPPPRRQRLTLRQREIIHSLLAEDMQAFSQEYGFDVKRWGF